MTIAIKTTGGVELDILTSSGGRAIVDAYGCAVCISWKSLTNQGMIIAATYHDYKNAAIQSWRILEQATESTVAYAIDEMIEEVVGVHNWLVDELILAQGGEDHA